MKFRYLRADEVDARVSTVSEKGCSILLYKDARCDQNILDECVGSMNWQRHHSRDNANCIVSIWDKEKQQWIEKEDTGTESYTEKEKGLASDSFKRACFNWGIGRELYTAPFIWFSANQINLADRNGKKTTYDTFKVTEMEVENGKIVSLKVMNNKTHSVYSFEDKQAKNGNQVPEAKQNVTKMKIDTTKITSLTSRCLSDSVDAAKLCELYKVKGFGEFTEAHLSNINNNWDKIKEMCAR